jgi:hypothetical protein
MGGADQSGGAYSGALKAQITAQQVPAGIRGGSHKTTEPAATTRVAAGSSINGPVMKTGEWRGQDSNL